jgi:RecA-family ATPase
VTLPKPISILNTNYSIPSTKNQINPNMTQPPNEENNNPDFNELEKHLDDMSREVPKQIGPLVIKTASQTLADSKLKPTPRRLFGSMWFENEVTFLYADTNIGKSIMAVQIGEAIASGTTTCHIENETEATRVLYFDFELTDKQFERRYTDAFGNEHNFSPNFYRVGFDTNQIPPDDCPSYEHWLNECVEQAVIATGAKILIIDNLTYLRNDTERARDAGPFMKHLKRMKNRYDLSLLILAHTPKRDRTRPINENDLQGSSMLGHFADATFAMGSSAQGNNYRYIKQFKCRNDEKQYGEENVIVLSLEKQNTMLRFEPAGYSPEHVHLVKNTDKENKEEMRREMVERVKDLKAQGKTQREIADELDLGLGTINRLITQAKCSV